ncbi:unnamed protein product [Moneuplotes crassus]|uniref:50S ribosomal protein L17 n=1 Tax=Euplotes crassus TaxID=5936 RepID=A0AAD1XLS6_EUPCR|nr:unnamed protein product [Moneuplotes crassus]
MRHKFKVKQFGRRKKHRDAMFRNLVQELVLHERIYTTYTKAMYMRPLAEFVINKAKGDTRKAHHHLGKIFYKRDAKLKAMRELAPRFKDQNGGYVRVVKSHIRRGDKAQMAYIEYIGNSIEIFEEENRIREQETKNLPSFWEWEMKILEQEREFYENEIMRLTGQTTEAPQIEDTQEEVDDQVDHPKEETKDDETQTTQKESVKAEDLYTQNLVKNASSPIVDMSGSTLSQLSVSVANQIKHLEKNINRVEMDIELHIKEKDNKNYGRHFEPF